MLGIGVEREGDVMGFRVDIFLFMWNYSLEKETFVEYVVIKN